MSNGFWATAIELPPANVEKISLALSSVLLQVKDPAPLRPCQFRTRNSLCNPLYLDHPVFSRFRTFRELQSSRPPERPGAPAGVQGPTPEVMNDLQPLPSIPPIARFPLPVSKLPSP